MANGAMMFGTLQTCTGGSGGAGSAVEPMRGGETITLTVGEPTGRSGNGEPYTITCPPEVLIVSGHITMDADVAVSGYVIAERK